MRELTPKAIALGAVLAVVLAAANAYLGLKVGMTVSASIPAAVISLGLFRLIRSGTILENNLVQTAASAGESLAAGVIFTFPALILIGYWDGFPYRQITGLALAGGLLGVAFSVPLRRVLLSMDELRFPEGVATAEVLQTGHRTQEGIGLLALGAAAGGFLKVCQTGFQLVAGSVRGGVTTGNGVIAAGWDLSAALIAVGYIVRLNVASLVFIGGAISWWVAIPIYTAQFGLPEGADGRILLGYEAARMLWSTKIRYLGVGAMVVGGLWAIGRLAQPLIQAAFATRASLRRKARQRAVSEDQTDRDAPLPVILGVIGLTALCLVPLLRMVLPGEGASLWIAIAIGLVLVLVAGFLFSAVAGYMAGLVGSSNNPISGITIATILLSASCLVLVVPGDPRGTAMAILVGAVVCCAAAISGDNLQDLKAGQLVGATPYRQQVMQTVGVVAGALTLGPVLNLLYQAYGLGDRLPRPGMNPTQALPAPQATLMQSVAQGVFEHNLEWKIIAIGAGIAVAVIACDLLLEKWKASFRMPVLAVAVGMYLPIELTVPICMGGLVATLSDRRTRDRPSTNLGLLLASGLIAGEALAGIALAIPFAAARDTGILSLAPPGWEWVEPWFGIAAMTGIMIWFYLCNRRRHTMVR
jgi:putative OPT family oligopeptide transporter